MASNLATWKVDLSKAMKILVPGEVIRLQKKLVFLTLGAAVEISKGKYKRLTGVVLLTPVDEASAAPLMA